MYKCPLCGEKFNNRREFEKHYLFCRGGRKVKLSVLNFKRKLFNHV